LDFGLCIELSIRVAVIVLLLFFVSFFTFLVGGLNIPVKFSCSRLSLWVEVLVNVDIHLLVSLVILYLLLDVEVVRINLVVRLCAVVCVLTRMPLGMVLVLV
jgi:hypothetical protein